MTIARLTFVAAAAAVLAACASPQAAPPTAASPSAASLPAGTTPAAGAPSTPAASSVPAAGDPDVALTFSDVTATGIDTSPIKVSVTTLAPNADGVGGTLSDADTAANRERKFLLQLPAAYKAGDAWPLKGMTEAKPGVDAWLRYSELEKGAPVEQMKEWEATSGTIKIDAVAGNEVSYSFDARFVPYEFAMSKPSGGFNLKASVRKVVVL